MDLLITSQFTAKPLIAPHEIEKGSRECVARHTCKQERRTGAL